MPSLAGTMLQSVEAGLSSNLVGDVETVSFAGILGCRIAAQTAVRFAGSVVVLAIADQLRAALALIALDGVARRIVLLPGGEDVRQRAALCDAAEADHVIEDWPLPSTDICEPWSVAAAPAHCTEWVLLTSGTTGVPKLVVHTLQTLAGHIIGRRKPNADRVWCTFYDTRRYGGLQVLLRSLIQTETLILPRPDIPLHAFLAHAAAHGATHIVGTPSHYRQAFISGAISVLSPRYLRLSGEIADQVVLDRLRDNFPHAEIVHAFASTEAGLAFEVADGRAGLPADLAAVAVQGVQAEIRQLGLHIRSPSNALGYLNRTRVPVASEDGFVETGDLLTLQEQRYQFTGRKTGEVNIGGRKVHPEEVEATLYEHAAVELCAVWARHNAITGALVAADIVCAPATERRLSSHATTSAELARDIQQFCRARLPSYKVPVSIRFVSSLAVGRSGKLARQHA